MSEIPEEISKDFEAALLAEDPIPKLVEVMLKGLEAKKAVGTVGNDIDDWPTRLNYVKTWAEWCHFVKPTPTIQDPTSATEEIIERVQRLLTGRDSENPPETQPL